MNVLLLSPYWSKLVPALEEQGDTYKVWLDPVSSENCLKYQFDFVVSYGYRHLLRKDFLSRFPNKCVNLHISMLPNCRGAHPNFWSIVENCTSGVTIHHLDEGLDTGNILFQQEVVLNTQIDTFYSSYCRLSVAIERLFFLNWKYLRTGECSGWKQQGLGSFHRARELDDWLRYLPLSWETPISLFKQLSFGSQ